MKSVTRTKKKKAPAQKASATSTPASRAPLRTPARAKTTSSTTKGGARTSYHHGDLRRAILDAAHQELDAVGPAAFSMREVARRAGVSHAAPAHHFPTKDDLLAALGVDGFRLFADALRAASDEGGDVPRARLLAMGRGYLRFAREHPGLFKLMWGAMPMSHCAQWRQPSNDAFMVLVDAVARVRAEAGFSGSPLGDAMLQWTFVHGLAKLEADMPSEQEIASYDEIYRYTSERMIAIFDRGVVPPAPLDSPYSDGPPT